MGYKKTTIFFEDNKLKVRRKKYVSGWRKFLGTYDDHYFTWDLNDSDWIQQIKNLILVHYTYNSSRQKNGRNGIANDFNQFITNIQSKKSSTQSIPLNLEISFIEEIIRLLESVRQNKKETLNIEYDISVTLTGIKPSWRGRSELYDIFGLIQEGLKNTKSQLEQNKKIETLSLENVQLNNTISLQNSTISSLNEEKQALFLKTKQLDKTITQKDKMIVGLQTKNEELNRKPEEKNEVEQQNRSSIIELQEEKIEQKSKLEIELKQLQKENEELKRKIKELESKEELTQKSSISNGESTIVDKETEKKENRKASNYIEVERKKPNKKEKIEKFSTKCQQLEEEIDIYQQTLQTLNMKIVENNETIEKLVDDIETIKKGHSQAIETITNENMEIKDKNKNLEKENKWLWSIFNFIKNRMSGLFHSEIEKNKKEKQSENQSLAKEAEDGFKKLEKLDKNEEVGNVSYFSSIRNVGAAMFNKLNKKNVTSTTSSSSSEVSPSSTTVSPLSPPASRTDKSPRIGSHIRVIPEFTNT